MCICTNTTNLCFVLYVCYSGCRSSRDTFLKACSLQKLGKVRWAEQLVPLWSGAACTTRRSNMINAVAVLLSRGWGGERRFWVHDILKKGKRMENAIISSIGFVGNTFLALHLGLVAHLLYYVLCI